MRQFLVPILAVWLGLVSSSAGAGEGGEKKAHGVAIAVIDFEYQDTSGEERDQSKEHETRLGAFMIALRSDLDKSAAFRIVTPTCGAEPCSAKSSTADNLVAAARDAGADILLLGGVHKMSTLVQWAEIEAIDPKDGRVLFKKLFTFRGDNDESWRRAEAFIFEELTSLPPS